MAGLQDAGSTARHGDAVEPMAGGQVLLLQLQVGDSQMKALMLAAVVGLGGVVAGCTTTSSGDFYPVTDKKDTYEVQVSTTAFAPAGTADDRAKVEITNFMHDHGFKSYEIVHTKVSGLTNTRYYTVRFD
jgi:hypothetical protein